MKHALIFTRLIASASLLCLSATAWSAAEGKPCPAKQSAAVPASAEPAARKTAWVTGQIRTAKTRMGVGMRYAMSEPSVGNPGVLNLKLTRLGNGAPVTVELRPDPELGMGSGAPVGPVAFNAGDEYSINIRPDAEGLYYIHVYLQSGQMAEALAIPVQVGKTVRLSKTGTVSTMPDGQRVISMPAQQ